MFHVEQSGRRKSVLRCSQDNETRSKYMKPRIILAKQTCKECGRVFDLFNPQDENEWYAGHDCEGQPPTKYYTMTDTGGFEELLS